MPEFDRAGEAMEIARELIPLHHGHLAGRNILYLFRYPAARSGGSPVLGRARRASDLERLLAEESPELLIEIAGDLWDDMTLGQRRALIDHQLCHFIERRVDGAVIANKTTGEVEITLRPHDFEDFAEIIARHGTWSDGLAEALREFKQLDLFSRVRPEDEELEELEDEELEELEDEELEDEELDTVEDGGLIALGVIVNTLHGHHGRPLKLAGLTRKLGPKFCRGLDVMGLVSWGLAAGVIQNPKAGHYAADRLWVGLPQSRRVVA